MRQRKRVDNEWLVTTLFSGLARDLDDGQTTTLYRFGEVLGLSYREAKRLAREERIPGYVHDEEGRDLVRIDRRIIDEVGLVRHIESLRERLAAEDLRAHARTSPR